MNMWNRRQFVARVSALAAVTLPFASRARELPATPAQAEGPYYPVKMPAYVSNNLRVHGTAIAEGVPLILTGQVTDRKGAPLSHLTVEIWQADNRGIYRHPRAPQQGAEDPNFPGFGAAKTDESGRFTFETIVPVPYTGRPPHIHVKLKRGADELLTTQLYVDGHAENEKGLLQSLFFRNSDKLMMRLADGANGKQTRFDFVV